MPYTPPPGNNIPFDLTQARQETAGYAPFRLGESDPQLFINLEGTYHPPTNPIWFELSTDSLTYALQPKTAHVQTKLPTTAIGQAALDWYPAPDRLSPRSWSDYGIFYPTLTGKNVLTPKSAGGGQYYLFNLTQPSAPPEGDNIIFDCALEVFEENTLYPKPVHVFTNSLSSFFADIPFLSEKSDTVPTARATLQQIISLYLSPDHSTPYVHGDIRRFYHVLFTPDHAAPTTNITKFYTNPVLSNNSPDHTTPDSSFEAVQLPEWYKPYRQQGGILVPWEQAVRRFHVVAFEAEDGTRQDPKKLLPWQEGRFFPSTKTLAAKDMLPADKKQLSFNFAKFDVYLDPQTTLAALDGLPTDRILLDIVYEDLDLFYDVTATLAATDGVREDISWKVFCTVETSQKRDKKVTFAAKDGVYEDRLAYDIAWGRKQYLRPCQWYPKLPERGDQINFDFTDEDKQLLGNPTQVRKRKYGKLFQSVAD